jgi:hypothetical protein
VRWAETTFNSSMSKTITVFLFGSFLFVRPDHQSNAAPAVEFTTVPVIKRPRSEAMSTAAFAVSETLAGTLRKFDPANCAII